MKKFLLLGLFFYSTLTQTVYVKNNTSATIKVETMASLVGAKKINPGKKKYIATKNVTYMWISDESGSPKSTCNFISSNIGKARSIDVYPAQKRCPHKIRLWFLNGSHLWVDGEKWKLRDMR